MEHIPSGGGGGSVDTLLDELLKNANANVNGCTHTHTCNPPGPDHSHTHTCFHLHTKTVSTASDDNDDSADSAERKTRRKRPLSNREAVRKYREKKKARAASLEDEVVKLRAFNQLLFKKLQGQSALEAEVSRLKCLLVDVRGRIEGEIGSFPYKISLKSVASPGSSMMSPCNNVQYGNPTSCLHPAAQGKTFDAFLNDQGFSDCDLENLNCFANVGAGSEECLGRGPCDMENMASTANLSGGNIRKGDSGSSYS